MEAPITFLTDWFARNKDPVDKVLVVDRVLRKILEHLSAASVAVGYRESEVQKDPVICAVRQMLVDNKPDHILKLCGMSQDAIIKAIKVFDNRIHTEGESNAAY